MLLSCLTVYRYPRSLEHIPSSFILMVVYVAVAQRYKCACVSVRAIFLLFISFFHRKSPCHFDSNRTKTLSMFHEIYVRSTVDKYLVNYRRFVFGQISFEMDSINRRQNRLSAIFVCSPTASACFCGVAVVRAAPNCEIIVAPKSVRHCLFPVVPLWGRISDLL